MSNFIRRSKHLFVSIPKRNQDGGSIHPQKAGSFWFYKVPFQEAVVAGLVPDEKLHRFCHGLFVSSYQNAFPSGTNNDNCCWWLLINMNLFYSWLRKILQSKKVLDTRVKIFRKFCSPQDVASLTFAASTLHRQMTHWSENFLGFRKDCDELWIW